MNATAGVGPAAPRHYFAVDTLRGIAALSVLVFHYVHFFYPIGVFELTKRQLHATVAQMPLPHLLKPIYLYGGSAVEVFWCISGFVFASVYAGRKVPAGDFALRRFARLYPLSLLTLLVVAALQGIAYWHFGTFLIYQYNDLHNFVLHVFMASAWGLGNAFSFNNPIWSVSVELVIYALFWIVSSRLFRFGILGPLAMAAVMLALVALGLPQFMFWRCGLYFFLGAAIYRLVQVSETQGGNVALYRLLAVAVASFVAGCLTYLFYRPELTFVMPMFGVALVAAAVAADHTPATGLCRRIRVIGDSTYGTYLWHIPIQLVLLMTLDSLGVRERVAHSPLFMLFFLALTATAGWASFRFIEKPANRAILAFAHMRRTRLAAVEW